MAAIQYQKGWLDVLKMHDNILEAADYLHELGNRDYGTYMTHQHTKFEQIVDHIVEEIQVLPKQTWLDVVKLKILTGDFTNF